MKMYKGDVVCEADVDQEASMKVGGWSRRKPSIDYDALASEAVDTAKNLTIASGKASKEASDAKAEVVKAKAADKEAAKKVAAEKEAAAKVAEATAAAAQEAADEAVTKATGK